ncbi:MAG: AMP-dependent synthetase/ligase [Myxococcota bacterium]
MPEQQHYSNLVDMFLKSIERYPDNRLFGVKRDGRYQWITYREVGEQVKHFRAGLASLGVGKGDKVAIIANNRPEWAVGAYATYSLGAQYVPMYEAQLEKDWKYILNDSGTKVLLVASQEIYDRTKSFIDECEALEYVVNLEGDKDEATSFLGLLEAGKEGPVDPVEPDKDDICGFIYTSGTTGNPKGVLLSHYNIASNINAVHDIFPMDESDTSLSFLPWAHSFGQTVELHTLLSYGASMGIAESVPKIIENLAEVQPTLLFSVPRIFNKIYDGVHKKMAAAGGLKKKLFDKTLDVAGKRRDLASQGRSSMMLDMQYGVLDKLVGSKVRERFGGRLKYAFSGGAALSKEVGEFVDGLGITVYEGYGLTETAPIATANRPGAQRIGTVGKPIPGVRVEVVPVETAPEGEGEIVVYGPNVMKGYHNLPEETAKVFTEDGGFRTGDMGRLDDDGFLHITGRVKEQYKLENGKYVVPAPLEEKLKLSPFINQIMIDGTNRPFNVAIVVPDLETVREWAKEHGVSADTDEALVKDPKVHKQVQREIERWSKDFKAYEVPKKFTMVAQEFSTDNDMLTPTLKLKRRNVIEAYGDELDTLYKDAEAA